MTASAISKVSVSHIKATNLKCIMVNLNTLKVALPVPYVDKVIKQPQILGSGLNHVGVTNYDGEAITVIDLYYQLFQIRQDFQTKDSYLIIAKLANETKVAFPVKGTPNLIEISATDMRVLPGSYRQADTLGIASHLVKMSQPSGQDEMIFILDLDYLVSQYSNIISPENSQHGLP